MKKKNKSCSLVLGAEKIDIEHSRPLALLLLGHCHVSFEFLGIGWGFFFCNTVFKCWVFVVVVTAVAVVAATTFVSCSFPENSVSRPRRVRDLCVLARQSVRIVISNHN